MEVVKAVDPQVRFMPSDVVLKVGFIAQNLSFILQLETVNRNLEAYYDAWDKFIKSWIVIKINEPSCVYQWRLQVGRHSTILP